MTPRRSLRSLLPLLALCMPAALLAQTAVPAAEAAAAPGFWASLDPFGWFLILTAGALALIVFILLFTVVLLVDHVVKQQVGYSPVAKFFGSLPVPNFLTWKGLTGMRAAPGKESHFDQDLEHDYDGIRELDNGAPPIFNYIFYGTIGFAAIYLFAFWGLNSNSLRMDWEYQQEMKIAAAQKAERDAQTANKVDEATVVVLTDAGEVAKGKQIYTTSCQACHGANGEGGVGPNLTDEYWLHGGDVKSVFKTVKYGVPDKGMVSWQSQLSPSQIAEVSSYILTLQGTHPANAKAPQGAKWVQAPDSAAASTSQGAAPADARLSSAQQ